MQQDRRNFLKIFGVGTAAVVSAKGEVEIVRDPEAEQERYQTRASGSYPHLIADMMDVVAGALYDRINVDRGSLRPGYPPPKFFSDVEASSGKTYSDTNLCRNRWLEPPEMFLVKRVGVIFSPNIDPKVRNAVVSRYALEIWIGQKNYLRLPLVEAFIHPRDALRPVEDSSYPDKFKGLYTLDIPLLLTSHNSFYAGLNGGGFNGVNPKFSLWCLFHGLHARGVC